MLETSTIFAVKNGSFHSFDVYSYDGQAWQSDLDGEQFDAAWKAECHIERVLIDHGYQVFFEMSECLEFMQEITV